MEPPVGLWTAFKSTLVSPRKEIRLWRDRAAEARRQGDPDAAVEHLDRAAELSIDAREDALLSDILITRGGLLLQNNHPRAALKDYDRLLETVEREMKCYEDGSEICDMDRQLWEQEGQEEFAEILRLARARDLKLILTMIHNNRALAWQDLGEADKAMEESRRLILHSPEYVQAYYDLAKRRPEEGRRLFERLTTKLTARYGLTDRREAALPIGGRTEDISAGGVKLTLAGRTRLRERESGLLTLDSGRDIGDVKLIGKVRWQSDRPEADDQISLGVQLIGLELPEWDRWLKLLGTRAALSEGEKEED